MSADELFPAEVVAMLSPRPVWMERHGVRTAAMNRDLVGTTSPETGDEIAPWIAWKERVSGELPGAANTATGDTEDEALAGLARRFGIRLWNEEAP